MRRQPIPSNILKKLKSENKGYCGVCLIMKGREIHHITPLIFGGDNSRSNLINLCNFCHYHSPNSTEEFNEYKTRGGILWQFMKLGYLTKDVFPKLKTKNYSLNEFKPVIKMIRGLL